MSCAILSENFLLFTNKKGDLFGLFKKILSHVLNQDSKLLPHKWWHTSWIFRFSRPVGKDRWRRQGCLEGKKSDLSNPKIVEKGLVWFFWNCTVLVNFSTNITCFFTVTSICVQGIWKKRFLGQHCSSIQTHHDSDQFSVAVIHVFCGQLTAYWKHFRA